MIMSVEEDIGQTKPKGDGLFTDDDVDTRMKYKENQKDKKTRTSRVKVQSHTNRQRRVR